MGDLKYERRYYIRKSTNQKIYLLDEALDLNLVVRTSPNLILKMIDNALKTSYRKSLNDVIRTTNTSVGTMYFAGYEDREYFDNIVNSGIAEKYDVDEINHVILNGDGASWISVEAEMNANMIYQLDLFHIYQKANRKIKDENIRKEINELIKADKYDYFIGCLFLAFSGISWICRKYFCHKSIRNENCIDKS